jgi:thiol-disulfide isomerase/thioredoxin
MRILAIALVLLLVYVAYSAMQGLTHHECLNPACKCEPCKCGRLGCHCRATPVVPVVVTPVEPQPPEPVKLRAYIVVGCKDERCPNPRCPSKPHLAIVKELRERGWQLTLLDKSEAATLPIEGDKYPYVVVMADGQPMGGKFLTTAFDIGTWLNEQRAGVPGGEWEVVKQSLTTESPAGLYSLAQVSGGESCPPCMAFARDQHSIEEELGAKVDVTHINLHNLPLRVTLGKDQTTVDSVPTTFLLLDGRIVDRVSGYRGKRAFLSWLAKAEKANGGRWR